MNIFSFRREKECLESVLLRACIPGVYIKRIFQQSNRVIPGNKEFCDELIFCSLSFVSLYGLDELYSRKIWKKFQKLTLFSIAMFYFEMYSRILESMTSKKVIEVVIIKSVRNISIYYNEIIFNLPMQNNSQYTNQVLPALFSLTPTLIGL